MEGSGNDSNFSGEAEWASGPSLQLSVPQPQRISSPCRTPPALAAPRERSGAKAARPAPPTSRCQVERAPMKPRAALPRGQGLGAPAQPCAPRLRAQARPSWEASVGRMGRPRARRGRGCATCSGSDRCASPNWCSHLRPGGSVGRRVPERPAGAPPLHPFLSPCPQGSAQSPWTVSQLPFRTRASVSRSRRRLGRSCSHVRVLPAVFGGRPRTPPSLTAADIVLHFLGGIWTLAPGGDRSAVSSRRSVDPLHGRLAQPQVGRLLFAVGLVNSYPGGFLRGVCGRGGAVVCPPLAVRHWASYFTPGAPGHLGAENALAFAVLLGFAGRQMRVRPRASRYVFLE